MLVDHIDIVHGVVRIPSSLIQVPLTLTSKGTVGYLTLMLSFGYTLLAMLKYLYFGGQFLDYCQSLIEFS